MASFPGFAIFAPYKKYHSKLIKLYQNIPKIPDQINYIFKLNDVKDEDVNFKEVSLKCGTGSRKTFRSSSIEILQQEAWQR
jgi:hypothetical protein